MTTRRREGETVHEFQHRLIAERKAAYDAHPRRSGLDKHLRREASKHAWWTLQGHLRGLHAYHGSFFQMTWETAEAIHDKSHAEHQEATL